MGDRRRQRDGRPGAVPVGKARAGDRTLTAGSDRQANGTPGPAGLLGTGRDRRDGNRCGRSDRRSYRIADHVQPAAADRRDHHRGGLAAAADDPGSARSTFVRARHHRLAAGDCHRLHRQFLRRDTTPNAVLGGLAPRFQGTESVLLAAAIMGATVMPHAVYLHSGLARDRHGHPDRALSGAGCCASPAGMSAWRC